MGKKNGVFKFITGALVGAGLGVLFAPKSGNETRKELKVKLDELIASIKDIDVAEVKANVENKVEELKKELEELDKEKVMKIAKKKADEIGKKANELVEYAKEKGTPVIESLASSAREKAILVTKDVLAKLESTKEVTK